MSIDFLSTRDGIDPQARACARLLAAVIVQGIRDCAEPTTDIERKTQTNRQFEARAALRWIFTPEPSFVAFCHLIGADASAIALALLENHDLPLTSAFTAMHRRTLQIRHRWFLQLRRAEKNASSAEVP